MSTVKVPWIYSGNCTLSSLYTYEAHLDSSTIFSNPFFLRKLIPPFFLQKLIPNQFFLQKLIPNSIFLQKLIPNPFFLQKLIRLSCCRILGIWGHKSKINSILLKIFTQNPRNLIFKVGNFLPKKRNAFNIFYYSGRSSMLPS